MPAPTYSVGSMAGQPNYKYAGRVNPGQGRPDQVGMPRYNYQPQTSFPQLQGTHDIYGRPTGRSVAGTPLGTTASGPANQNGGQPGGGVFGGSGGFGGAITTGIGTGPAVGNDFLSQMNNGLINTSITPTGIYSPQQTQQAMHQGVASAQQGANMPWLQSQMRRPGMSVNSPATQSRALPTYAGALAQGQEAQWAIPMQDMIANAQHMLSGETAREDEALGWGRLQSMLNTAQNRFGAQMLSTLLSQFVG